MKCAARCKPTVQLTTFTHPTHAWPAFVQPVVAKCLMLRLTLPTIVYFCFFSDAKYAPIDDCTALVLQNSTKRSMSVCLPASCQVRESAVKWLSSDGIRARHTHQSVNIVLSEAQFGCLSG